ncbi:hypothetical protein [Amycolatopsis kentuckyensis]|uniref:hypothetical protein n=1 Tax=Amycolatopsis kentuckyensis TaxID=218823 RepID=UPI000A3CF59E|nr:hypothetical protein [Amycolatopsis kentuckyensis]
MTDDLTWAPPPPVNRGGRRPSQEWFDIAAKLRQKPGEWAIVKSAKSPSNASDIAMRIRRGGIEAFAPADTFEATSRSDGGDMFVVYARYVEVDGA